MLAVLNERDSWSAARNVLKRMGESAEEWAGLPMPIDGETLTVEPSYRFAPAFQHEPEPDEDGVTLRNHFWSTRWRREILVWDEAGKVRWGPVPGVGHIDQDLRTIGCSVAWGIEQEQRALKLLGTMVKHHTFKMYLLTGMFLETSERSGVSYLFRRLKPTVALKAQGEKMKVLCALCMHPIAYYADSWAGAMCPTDDVIAHLAMMRSDEPMFWRRANQHPPHVPQAGL